MVLLIVGNLALVLAYTYFGKKTYVELDRKSLNQTADSIQELFTFPLGQEMSVTALNDYFNSLLPSNEISFVLTIYGSHERKNTLSNRPDLIENTHIQ